MDICTISVSIQGSFCKKLGVWKGSMLRFYWCCSWEVDELSSFLDLDQNLLSLTLSSDRFTRIHKAQTTSHLHWFNSQNCVGRKLSDPDRINHNLQVCCDSQLWSKNPSLPALHRRLTAQLSPIPNVYNYATLERFGSIVGLWGLETPELLFWPCVP